MNKLDMESLRIVDENIEKIGNLFPNVVVESDKGKSIDFELLKQELSKTIVDEGKEKYQLTWPGKKESIVNANTPTNKTLRPIREKSVDFDNTENIYIEGDNLEALKILQESYLNKINLIYIDPPYNTGRDFLYNDNCKSSNDEELKNSGQIDNEGLRLTSNYNTDGKFHSKWISNIYSRLKLSRMLLKDDGIIMISIDDKEVNNLRKICDEIFGENNFVAQIIVEGTPKNDPYIVSTAHEYCLVYTKNFANAKEHNYGISNPLYKKLLSIFNKYNEYDKIEDELKTFYSINGLSSDNIANYKYADKNGIFRIGPIDDPQNSGAKDKRINPKTGCFCKIPSRGWSCNLSTWNDWIKNDLILFPDDDNMLPSKKTYISDQRLDVMKAYFKIQTRKDSDYLKKLFNSEITLFSNPKPKELIKTFINNCNNKDLLGLDFYAGSGTFGEAIFELNIEDGGRRKFILVQIPQILDVKNSQSNKEKKITEAAINYLKKKNLPLTISEITQERLRNYLNLANNDLVKQGFRVYKIDSSNMKDVYYKPKDLNQGQLSILESNIKEDRNNDDLLTQVILDLGLTLDLKIEEKVILNNKVYFVDNDSLVACFDENINIDIISEICKFKPLKVVFKDSSFSNDNDKINIFEKLKKLSPDTEMSVI